MSQEHHAPDGTTSPGTVPVQTAPENQGDDDDIPFLRRVEELVRQHKQHTYELMRVEPGQYVLDLGCGPGTDTIPLARIVGPGGRVVGVDFDPEMLAEAARRAHEAGVAGWVQHLQAEATALPLGPDTCDASRSERLFQHLVDPAAALAEMARVTKPGGWVVVLDADWGSLSIDTPETDIERRLVRRSAEAGHRSGRVGRELYRLFKRQGLEAVSVEGFVVILQSEARFRDILLAYNNEQAALEAGVVTEDELQRWRAALAQADAEGTFFASMLGFIAAGRTP
ncbi:MAG TPA: methyltransferase domain-containing protein [Ktedonobacterales bacterium]|nr:methyltransferase domain-containing protein [Ktedonobacterales bacterium]